MTDPVEKWDPEELAQVREAYFNPTVKNAFNALIIAKQFLKRANNDQLNVYLADAVQRIDLSHRAEIAERVVRTSHSFIDSKLQEIVESRREEVCNHWAAVLLLQVRQAVRKGVVGDLSINWDTVKGMFVNSLHRKILDDELEDLRPQAAISSG